MKVVVDGKEIDYGEIIEGEDSLDYANPRIKKPKDEQLEDTLEISSEELEVIRKSSNHDNTGTN